MARRNRFDALHSSDRSGYSVDILGADTNPMGPTTPKGALSGGQEGLVDPPYRKYAKNVEALSLAEAVSRSIKRKQGALPPIQPSARIEDNLPEEKPKKREEQRATKAEKAKIEAPPVQRPAIKATSDAQGEPPAITTEVIREVIKEVVVEKELPEADKAKLDYYNNRRNLAIEVAGGKVLMVVVDIVVDDYGILLIGSAGSESGIFIPDPGTEVTIRDGDNSYPCYFPGAKYVLKDLGLIIMPFVRADG